MNKSMLYQDRVAKLILIRKEQMNHIQKMRSINSSIRTRMPDTLSNNKIKNKKSQNIEERYTEIEKNNRILLEKILLINKKGKLPSLRQISDKNKSVRLNHTYVNHHIGV